jgi:hypothetical protein
LYSSTVRGEDVIGIKHGDTPVQRTNRWYKSTTGRPIEKCVRQKNGDSKWLQVPNSDSSTVANTLASTALPDDLDYDHYTGAAQTLLNDILQSKPSKEIIQSKLIKQAKKAQERGLSVVPKGRRDHEKANVSGTYSPEVVEYWRKTPLEHANWRDHHGFGTYTGKEFGIVGIDIDHIEKAKRADLFKYLNKGGIVCWHGDFDPKEVRQGMRRGTLLFRYTGDELKTTGTSYFFHYGFEILYGKKVVQLAGPHPNGDIYRYRGSLTPLPKALLNYLAWTIPEEEAPAPEAPVDEDATCIDEQLQQFAQLANTDLEYTRTGGVLKLAQNKWGRQLVGLCVGHRKHTNHQGDQNMRVYVEDGELKTHCFHQSCWGVRKWWEARLKEEVCVPQKVIVKPENLVIRGDEREIAIALQDPARYKVIIAPPGSGKSHAIVLSIVPFLDSRSGNSDKFVIICSSKDQMIQFAQRFAAALGSDNINAQGIDLIEATGSIKVGRAKSRDAVRKSTRVAITHTTYVSRRRFSQHHYAFLKFIDENTNVYIDELEAYIESQKTHYPLGSRKRRIAKDGKIKNIHVSKCGMFHNYNNCTNCIMHKYDGNRMDVDDYRNLGYVPVSEFMEGTRLESLEHIDLESRTLATVRVRTTEVSMLKQYEDPGEIRFDDDGVMADFKSIFEDHLNSAYLPTVHRSVILYEGQEISRMDFIERFRLNQDSRVTDIPAKERAKLRFPSRACNVLTVTMIDRRPLLWMARAKSLTGLTATISPLQGAFSKTSLARSNASRSLPRKTGRSIRSS